MTGDGGRTVAIVPAKDSVETVGATVTALLSGAGIDDVVVVDDASVDGTATVAAAAGATVVRLAINAGKGGAMRAGLQAAPDADLYLFVDADTGTSSAAAAMLLEPVREGVADLVIGVLPSAGQRGGFGVVKRASAWAIRRACGFEARAPLSGQRAVRGDLLRRLQLAERFGVEVAMTIDAVRAGGRVLEMDVDMEHRHRGRRLQGFAHRGRQGAEIARALWPRVVQRRARLAVLVGLVAMTLATALWASSYHSGVDGQPLVLQGRPEVMLVPGLEWSDVPVELTGAMASVAAGDVDDVARVVATGSRDPDARPLADLSVFEVERSQVSTPGLLEARDLSAGLVIVGVAGPGDEPSLRPLIVPGAAGTLTSPSTRRTGLVDITDIAPTAATAAAAEVPDASGRPIRVEGESADRESLEATAGMAGRYEQVRPWFIALYAGVQVILYLAALGLARRGRSLPGAAVCALTIAAVPLATYVVRCAMGSSDFGVLGWSALMVLAVGMIATMSGRTARSTPAALRAVLLATLVLIAADVLTGTRLQLSGIFGSSPALGTRYHGLGNPATVILLVATVVWSVLHVRASTRRDDAVIRVAALFAVLAAIVGLPGLGSDVGGLLAFAIVGVTTVLALRAGALSLRGLLLGAGGAVVLTAVAALIDLARPPSSRTHLGELAARVSDEGLAPLADVVVRKIEVNVLGYGFPWTIGVLAAALVAFALLTGSRRWTETLPAGSGVRIGAALGLLAGLVSYAVNDSGIVVLALSAVFVGPLLLAEASSRSSTPKLEVSSQ